MWTFIDTENITRIYNTKKKTTMKNVNLILSAMASLCMVFTGCSSDENLSGTDPDGRVALQVSSGIQTRAVNNQWEIGDVIGVFMLHGEKVESFACNVPYRTEDNGTQGTFKPDRQQGGMDIFLPTDGSSRDFMAYYPWLQTLDPQTNIYPIDLTDQTDQSAIDFMVADKVSGKNRLDNQAAFVFRHKLSKLILHIKPGADVSEQQLKGVVAKITNQPAKGTFDLLKGTDVIPNQTENKIDLVLATNSEGTYAEGIVFPSEDYTDMYLKFKTKDIGTYEWSLEESQADPKKFVSGRKYIYNITVNKTQILVDATIEDWQPGNGDGEDVNAE